MKIEFVTAVVAPTRLESGNVARRLGAQQSFAVNDDVRNSQTRHQLVKFIQILAVSRFARVFQSSDSDF
jgi:hypothetical protein